MEHLSLRHLSISGMSQLSLTRFSPNFKGRSLGQSWRYSIYHSEICKKFQQQKSLPKKNFAKKKLLKKCLPKRNFGKKLFFDKTIFCAKRNFGKKFFLDKTIFCAKRNFAPQKFCQQKICHSCFFFVFLMASLNANCVSLGWALAQPNLFDCKLEFSMQPLFTKIWWFKGYSQPLTSHPKIFLHSLLLIFFWD